MKERKTGWYNQSTNEVMINLGTYLYSKLASQLNDFCRFLRSRTRRSFMTEEWRNAKRETPEKRKKKERLLSTWPRRYIRLFCIR